MPRKTRPIYIIVSILYDIHNININLEDNDVIGRDRVGVIFLSNYSSIHDQNN